MEGLTLKTSINRVAPPELLKQIEAQLDREGSKIRVDLRSPSQGERWLYATSYKIIEQSLKNPVLETLDSRRWRTLMNSYFDGPIFVKDGSRIIREVATLEDAIEFLDSWPDAHRDLIYETAWRTCCEVFDGHKPLGVAHAAFEGFARKAKILEDPAAVMPWIMNAKSGGGLMTA